jgi:hypothetical protein
VVDERPKPAVPHGPAETESVHDVLSGHRVDDRDRRQTDRSLSLTTKYSYRRAATPLAEANQQVGTHLSSRPAAPPPTPTLRPPTPPQTTRSAYVTANPPPARPPPRLSLVSASPLLLLRPSSHFSSLVTSPRLHSPSRLSTNNTPVPGPDPARAPHRVWAGSGAGTGRNPRIHRESGVETKSISRSTPQSRSWSSPFRPSQRSVQGGRIRLG